MNDVVVHKRLCQYHTIIVTDHRLPLLHHPLCTSPPYHPSLVSLLFTVLLKSQPLITIYSLLPLFTYKLYFYISLTNNIFALYQKRLSPQYSCTFTTKTITQQCDVLNKRKKKTLEENVYCICKEHISIKILTAHKHFQVF